MKNSKAVSTLRLNLRRQWFAKIAAGEKRVEYRERKPYWQSRLEGRSYDVIEFRNGYGQNVPEMAVEFLGVEKIQRSGVPYYAIQLGRIHQIKRWKA